MKRFKGKLLTNVNGQITRKFDYCVISNVLDFEEGYNCIFTKYLNPDFTILLDKVQVIVTEEGSSLSHLAIIAREYNKLILLVKNIITKIPQKGHLFIGYKNGGVEIEIS